MQKRKPGRKQISCVSQAVTQTEKQQSENTGVGEQKSKVKQRQKTRVKQRQKTSKQSQLENLSHIVKTESIDDKGAIKHRNTIDEVPKKSKTNTRKHIKTPKVKVEDGTTDAGKETEKREGFCPVCQMPYAALSIVQSPTWHIDECLETPYSSKKG